MRAPLPLLLFLTIHLTANAADMQDIVDRIQNEGIQKSNQTQEAKKPSENPELPKELGFLKYHHKLDQELGETPSPQKITTTLIEKNLIDRYDRAYVAAQEECAFVFEGEPHDKKCEKLISLYEDINDDLNERLDDAEVVKDPVEQLFGANLDGQNVTEELTEASDPHSDLKEESEMTPNRNSPLQKGHTPNTDNETESLSVTELACRIQQRNDIDLPQDLLQKLVSKLENVLTSEDSSLKDKREAYCVLYSYYQQEELMDKITMFLYLNMPGKSLKCE